MAEHNVLGIQGEQLACRFLEQRGYVILERNWHHAKHELDIIAPVSYTHLRAHETVLDIV